MRVLVAIPHYYRSEGSRLYGSRNDPREVRAAAFRGCLVSLYAAFGTGDYVANLARPERRSSNQASQVDLHVVVCLQGDDHLMGELGEVGDAVERIACGGDPMRLGFACHRLLASRACEDYDFYCYLEDDLQIHDPWWFVKLTWFLRDAGDDAMLQPNRYEVVQDGSGRKVYIDGELAPSLAAALPARDQRGLLQAKYLGAHLAFEPAQNPHAGCFCLSRRQLDRWRREPSFSSDECSFVGPLESAATLSIARAFAVYKPHPHNASFLEIQHTGAGWLRKLAARDTACGVPMDRIGVPS